MLHAKLGRWFQPGGHADGDASLPGVALARRPPRRRASRALRRGACPPSTSTSTRSAPPHGPHLHLDVRYLVVAPPDAVPAGNHESLDLRWATTTS